jgi:hypothetical protein
MRIWVAVMPGADAVGPPEEDDEPPPHPAAIMAPTTAAAAMASGRTRCVLFM